MNFESVPPPPAVKKRVTPVPVTVEPDQVAPPVMM